MSRKSATHLHITSKVIASSYLLVHVNFWAGQLIIVRSIFLFFFLGPSFLVCFEFKASTTKANLVINIGHCCKYMVNLLHYHCIYQPDNLHLPSNLGI